MKTWGLHHVVDQYLNVEKPIEIYTQHDPEAMSAENLDTMTEGGLPTASLSSHKSTSCTSVAIFTAGVHGVDFGDDRDDEKVCTL